MNNHHTIQFLTLMVYLLALSACSQGKQSGDSTEESSSNKIEINLDDYIPEKPKLSPKSSVIDHLHDGTLIQKPPPSFPVRAEKSGHCIFKLDIDETGSVNAIQELKCSDEIFIKHTHKNLLKWRFYPKKDEYGKNIAFEVGPQKISYRLTDVDGNVIPE